MSDDVDFTVRLVEQITGPANSASKAIRQVITSTEQLDQALKKIDDAMAHQKWAALKQGEIASQKAAAAAKVHSDGLERVAASSEELEGVMGAVSGGLAIAAAAAVGLGIAAAAATAKIGEASVEAGMFAQKSTLAISMLTGGMGDAGEMFDEVRGMAQGLGLDVHHTQEAFQHFLAIQFTPDAAKDLIKMGADLQSIGASGEQVESVFHQLATIKSFGALHQHQLMLMAQAGVSEKLVIESLSRSMQKTPAEIQKALAAGTIKADEGIEAIKDAILHKTHESELGEAGAQFASTTLEGMRKQFSAGIDNALIDIGKAILPQMVIIGQSLSDILGKLGSSGKLSELKNQFIFVFSKIAEFVEMNMPAIESAITMGIDAIITVLRATGDVIDFVMRHWSAFATALEVVGVVVGVVAAAIAIAAATIMTPIALVIGGAVALFEVLKGTFNGIVDTIGSLLAPILDTFANISAIFDDTGMSWSDKLFAIGKQIVQGLVDGIVSLAELPVTIVKNIGSEIINAFGGKLEISSPSKVFEDFGAFTVQGYVEGVVANDNDALSATADLAKAATLGIVNAPHDVAAAAAVQPLALQLPQPQIGAGTGLQGVSADASTQAVQSAPLAPAAPANDTSAQTAKAGPTLGDVSITINVDGADASSSGSLAKDIGSEVDRRVRAIFEGLQATGTED